MAPRRKRRNVIVGRETVGIAGPGSDMDPGKPLAS